jgi:hypothetical protein
MAVTTHRAGSRRRSRLQHPSERDEVIGHGVKVRHVRAHGHLGTFEVMVAAGGDVGFSEVATLVVVSSVASIALAVGSAATGS